ncbi:hypothetical protein PG995_011397 [Apiospora arundinis]
MNDQQAEAPMPPQRGRPRKQPLEKSRRVAIHRGLSDLSTRPLHLLHPPRLLYPGVGLADHVPGPRLRLAYPAVVQVDLVLAPLLHPLRPDDVAQAHLERCLPLHSEANLDDHWLQL